jgi:hypothetical protein
MLLNNENADDQSGKKTGMIYAQSAYTATTNVMEALFRSEKAKVDVDNALKDLIWSALSDGRHYLVKLGEMRRQNPEFPNDQVVFARTGVILLTNPYEVEPGECLTWESLHGNNATQVRPNLFRLKPNHDLPILDFQPTMFENQVRCWERV